MSDTLSYRAAKYFGLQDEPRESILLGNGMVAIVAQRRGHMALGFYEENGWQGYGSWVVLSERKRAALVRALSA